LLVNGNINSNVYANVIQIGSYFALEFEKNGTIGLSI